MELSLIISLIISIRSLFLLTLQDTKISLFSFASLILICVFVNKINNHAHVEIFLLHFCIACIYHLPFLHLLILEIMHQTCLI